MSNCTVRTKALIFEGEGALSRFSFIESNDVCCEKMTFKCNSVHVTGNVELRTHIVELASQSLECSCGQGAEIGLNDVLRDHYAWRMLPSKLLFPIDAKKVRILDIIADFANRVGFVPIVLQSDFSPPVRSIGSDMMSWANRYGEDFRNFVRLLINKGLARKERSQEGKIKITFEKIDWSRLARACSGHESELVDSRIKEFVEEARWSQ